MEEFSIQISDLRLTLSQMLLLIMALLMLAYLIKTRFGGLW
jgi:hypothetical protein